MRHNALLGTLWILRLLVLIAQMLTSVGACLVLSAQDCLDAAGRQLLAHTVLAPLAVSFFQNSCVSLIVLRV